MSVQWIPWKKKIYIYICYLIVQYLTILSNNEARKNIIELNVASNSDVVSENVVEKDREANSIASFLSAVTRIQCPAN